MKKTFFSKVLLLATVFFTSTLVQAQRSLSEPSFKNPTATSTSESESPRPDESSINKKAIKSFNRKYPTSASVKWHSSRDGILASFRENGKLNRVFYRPNGRWLRTLTSYDQSLLDDGVKELIKAEFRKYEITNVTEVYEDNFHCYFINIDAPTDFQVVIVYEGKAFVHEQYRK
jgi:hypothetical protein